MSNTTNSQDVACSGGSRELGFEREGVGGGAVLSGEMEASERVRDRGRANTRR